jgi:hypothetical protein
MLIDLLYAIGAVTAILIYGSGASRCADRIDRRWGAAAAMLFFVWAVSAGTLVVIFTAVDAGVVTGTATGTGTGTETSTSASPECGGG